MAIRNKNQQAHDEYIVRENRRVKTQRSIDLKVERLRAWGIEAWNVEETRDLLHVLSAELYEDHRQSGH